MSKILTINGYSDVNNNSLVTERYKDASVNEGNSFSVTGEATIVGGATYNIAFTTPADKFIFHEIDVVSSVSSPLTIAFREGDVFSGGTEKAVQNRNRNSDNTSEVVVKEDVTVSDTGTLLEKFSVGSGGGPQTTAGGESGGGSVGMALKRGTEYLLEINNIGTEDTDIYYNINWNEVD